MGQALRDFINQYNGVAHTGNTPENKGECVGLIAVWIDKLRLPHVWGNAKDLLNNADKNYFDVIINNPKDFNQHPLPGDIMVFGPSWGGGFGHTGVIVEATGKDFILFEQNNPGGNPPEQIGHPDYQGVTGWLHPKVDLTSTITIPTSERDFLVGRSTTAKEVAQYLTIDNPDNAPTEAYTKVIAGIKGTATAAQTQLTGMKVDLATAQAEVANKDEQVSRLKVQVTEGAAREDSLSNQLKLAQQNQGNSDGVLKKQLESKQKELDQMAKDKGEALNDAAQWKAKYDAALSGQQTTSLWNAIINFLKGTKVVK